MRTVNKIQFGQLNDKRFCFSHGIVSLPYGHFLLDEIRKIKHKYRKIHTVISVTQYLRHNLGYKKWEFLKYEADALNKSERLRFLSQIYSATSKLYLLNSDTESEHKIECSTKEYIKSGLWQ